MRGGIDISEEFTYKKVSKGKVGGEVILSSDAVYFYTAELETDKVIESNHHLKDKNITGKILVIPSRKGSSVVQADNLYKLQLHGKASKAIIMQHAGTVLVSNAIIMKTPVVHKVEEDFYQGIKNGTKICVDVDSGKVTIF